MFKLTPDFLNLSTSFNPHNEAGLALSKNARWGVYFLFLVANILISLDHGTIPASTSQLRSFCSSDQAIGLFGSLVFVGNILGSICSFWLINSYNRKTLLVLSLFLLSLCLITFVLWTNILFLFINRIFVGLFQSYISIYLPVWCNQFGMESKKSLMITFGQLVVPLGVFLGYLLASIFIQIDVFGGWEFAFILQGICVMILSLFIAFVPSVYFNSDIRNIGDDCNDQTLFGIANHTFESINPNDRRSFWKVLSIIIKEKVFIFSVLGLSALFYVITGVQYWVSDYMDNILGVHSGKRRLLYFTFVCFTSPTIGVLLGGVLLNGLGGYDTKHSILIAVVLSILASVSGFFVPLVSNVTIFVTLLWFVLFFGGGILPVITGIIISSLPQSLTGSGNSFTSFVGNLFGYLPAPYIYGLFTDFFHDKGKMGMTFTMWFSFVGVGFIILASTFRYKEWDSKKKKIIETEHLIVRNEDDSNEMSELLLKIET